MTDLPAKTSLPGATGLLTIDLEAIRDNYARLASMAPRAECAAVVKGDAYGTGVRKVASYLHKAGCRTFFVATLNEGIALRALLPAPQIYILDGLFPASAPLFFEHRLSPVLGSLQSLREWDAQCAANNAGVSAALHIDTGMNRLGIGPDELPHLLEHQKGLLANTRLDLVMSHMACADEPAHPRNQKQLRSFRAALEKLPPVRASLANSAAIRANSDTHFDLLRPGISLYGGKALLSGDNPMRPVAFLSAPIAQIRWVEKGDAIGYGANYVTTRKTRLATLPVGYADGYLRALGTTNETTGTRAFVEAHPAPLLGRVSMDLITIDITDLPDDLARPGQMVELLGHHVDADELAAHAGTISYEILTSLKARYQRRYLGET